MIARTSKTKTRSNEDALAAFVQRKAEIDAMLTRLQALSDEHFDYSPDEITWGHVGTPGLLRRAAEAGHRQRLPRGRARRIADPISRPRPARLQPPGLGLVGERSCSPQMEIIP